MNLLAFLRRVVRSLRISPPSRRRRSGQMVAIPRTERLEVRAMLSAMAGPEAVPTITWPQPEPIEVGTPLGFEQLNASTAVVGFIFYEPGPGTVLPAGTHTLTARFFPFEPGYEPTTATRELVVLAPNAPPTLDPISPVTLLEDAPRQSILLSGISEGAVGEGHQTLSIAATASDPSLVGDLSVSYQEGEAMGLLRFTPVPDAFGTTEITVTIRDDGGGTDTTQRTFLVTVDPVNDVPTLDAPHTVVGNEDEAFAIPGLSVGDVDGDILDLTLDVRSGQLTVGSQTGSELALRGTADELGGLLASLTYQGDTDYWGDDRLELSLTDGQERVRASVDLSIAAVNDAPVNQVPGDLTTLMNIPLPIAGLGVDDVDLNEGTGELQVTLSVGHGTLSLDDGEHVQFLTGSSSGAATLTFSGSLNNVNKALESVHYTPDRNYAGPDTLVMMSDDLGNFPDRLLTDLDEVSISVFTPREFVTVLEATIWSFADDGLINRGQAKSLTRKLSLKGNVRAQVRRLEALENQISSLIRIDRLDAEDERVQFLQTGLDLLEWSLEFGGKK